MAWSSSTEWRWPDSDCTRFSISGSLEEDQQPSRPVPESTPTDAQDEQQWSAPEAFEPRTCRICLDTVQPTLVPPSEHLPNFLQSRPQVIYESPPPEGRLIHPCRCKGSSGYVHEGCLSTWRHASYSDRNFWHCPTCGFQYRIERLRWGRWISSSVSQLILTLLILLFAMFLLGFVSDPIINFYSNPLSVFIDDDWDAEIEVLPGQQEWIVHFMKGFASLGVLSFIKVLLAASPWHWWNMRGSGLVGRTRRTTGRDRLTYTMWVVVLIGVATFLWVSVVHTRYTFSDKLRVCIKASGRGVDASWREPVVVCSISLKKNDFPWIISPHHFELSSPFQWDANQSRCGKQLVLGTDPSVPVWLRTMKLKGASRRLVCLCLFMALSRRLMVKEVKVAGLTVLYVPTSMCCICLEGDTIINMIIGAFIVLVSYLMFVVVTYKLNS